MIYIINKGTRKPCNNCFIKPEPEIYRFTNLMDTQHRSGACRTEHEHNSNRRKKNSKSLCILLQSSRYVVFILLMTNMHYSYVSTSGPTRLPRGERDFYRAFDSVTLLTLSALNMQIYKVKFAMERLRGDSCRLFLRNRFFFVRNSVRNLERVHPLRYFLCTLNRLIIS